MSLNILNMRSSQLTLLNTIVEHNCRFPAASLIEFLSPLSMTWFDGGVITLELKTAHACHKKKCLQEEACGPPSWSSKPTWNVGSPWVQCWPSSPNLTGWPATKMLPSPPTCSANKQQSFDSHGSIHGSLWCRPSWSTPSSWWGSLSRSRRPCWWETLHISNHCQGHWPIESFCLPEATYQDRHLLLLLVLSSHGNDWHVWICHRSSHPTSAEALASNKRKLTAWHPEHVASNDRKLTDSVAPRACRKVILCAQLLTDMQNF